LDQTFLSFFIRKGSERNSIARKNEKGHMISNAGLLVQKVITYYCAKWHST
jgi:hypothetical protein